MMTVIKENQNIDAEWKEMIGLVRYLEQLTWLITGGGRWQAKWIEASLTWLCDVNGPLNRAVQIQLDTPTE